MRQGKGECPLLFEVFANLSQPLVAEKSCLIPSPRKIQLPLSHLRALPLVEGQRHHLQVEEGVVEFRCHTR
jgi:hypothetical protein